MGVVRVERRQGLALPSRAASLQNLRSTKDAPPDFKERGFTPRERMEKIDLKKTANPREQWLGVLVIVALFVMFFRIVYFPKKEDVDQMKGQIQSIQLEKEALEKFTQALLKTAPQGQEAQTKNNRSIKEQILMGETKPLANALPPLLSYITSQKFLKGIVIKAISDIPLKQETGYKKADFFIDAQGSFGNITRYLERIEKVPALVGISNVTIKAIDTKATQVALELGGTLFELEEMHAKPKS